MIKMITATAHKGQGLSDFLSSYTPGQLEQTHGISVKGNNVMANLLQIYQQFLEMDDLPCLHSSLMAETSSIEEMIQYFKDDIKEVVLSPAEINAFLQKTIFYEDEGWYTGLTGIFVSVLMQQSYEAGHNKFHLNVELFPQLDNLAVLVQGTKKKPIEISMTGNIGEHFGQGAAYARLQATKNGKIGFVGCRTQKSTLTLYGDVSDVGFHSYDSNFIIHGNVKEGLFGPLFSGAQKSTCSIDGSFEGNKTKLVAQNCTFTTPYKKTYALLKKHVPKGNKVILLKTT